MAKILGTNIASLEGQAIFTFFYQKYQIMQLEGYIEFENPIPVVASCLGKKFPLRIAGFNGILATPTMFRGFDSNNKLGPLENPEIGEIKFSDNFEWGDVYHWPKGDSGVRACKLLFSNIPPEQFELACNVIAFELEKWRARLIDNISFHLRKDYRGPARIRTYSSFGLGKFGLFRDISGINKRFIPENIEERPIEIIVGPILGLDEKGLGQIIEDSSNEISPLLPFYFFLDAERSLFEEEYRKSVLDSATAAEVCFSNLIGQLLPTGSENKLNRYIYSKHNSLKQKRELLKHLYITLPIREKEYNDNLDNIRNKVIHAGYFPSRFETKTALMITEKTLYGLLPFKNSL